MILNTRKSLFGGCSSLLSHNTGMYWYSMLSWCALGVASFGMTLIVFTALCFKLKWNGVMIVVYIWLVECVGIRLVVLFARQLAVMAAS